MDIPEDLSMFEYALASLGLGHPGIRALSTFTVINGIIYATKPSYFFDTRGNAKAWAGVTTGINTTWVPWWLPSVVGALYMGIFI